MFQQPEKDQGIEASSEAPIPSPGEGIHTAGDSNKEINSNIIDEPTGLNLDGGRQASDEGGKEITYPSRLALKHTNLHISVLRKIK